MSNPVSEATAVALEWGMEYTTYLFASGLHDHVEPVLDSMKAIIGNHVPEEYRAEGLGILEELVVENRRIMAGGSVSE